MEPNKSPMSLREKLQLKDEIIDRIREIMWCEALDPELRPTLPKKDAPMKPLENGYYSKYWPKEDLEDPEGSRAKKEAQYYAKRGIELASAIKTLIDYL